jgi:hypothetical protein
MRALPPLPTLLLPLLLLSTPATAAERQIGIGSIDRLRVDGPFEVRVTTGASPRVTIAGDGDAVAAVDVHVDGRTLAIRPGAGVWGSRPPGGGTAPAGPIVVTVGTPSLAAITSVAGARITATATKGDRVDLSVSGTGAIAVAGGEATQLFATVIGSGTIAVAGRTPRARLVVNGPGSIDADKLEVGDLTAFLDGPGTIGARARYTAGGANTGLGALSVAGQPKCTFRGQVACGAR